MYYVAYVMHVNKRDLRYSEDEPTGIYPTVIGVYDTQQRALDAVQKYVDAERVSPGRAVFEDVVLEFSDLFAGDLESQWINLTPWSDKEYMWQFRIQPVELNKIYHSI